MKLNEDKIHELPSIHPCVFYSFNFSFCHLLSLLFAIGFFSFGRREGSAETGCRGYGYIFRETFEIMLQPASHRLAHHILR